MMLAGTWRGGALMAALFALSWRRCDTLSDELTARYGNVRSMVGKFAHLSLTPVYKLCDETRRSYPVRNVSLGLRCYFPGTENLTVPVEMTDPSLGSAAAGTGTGAETGAGGSPFFAPFTRHVLPRSVAFIGAALHRQELIPAAYGMPRQLVHLLPVFNASSPVVFDCQTREVVDDFAPDGTPIEEVMRFDDAALANTSRFPRPVRPPRPPTSLAREARVLPPEDPRHRVTTCVNLNLSDTRLGSIPQFDPRPGDTFSCSDEGAGPSSVLLDTFSLGGMPSPSRVAFSSCAFVRPEATYYGTDGLVPIGFQRPRSLYRQPLLQLLDWVNFGPLGGDPDGEFSLNASERADVDVGAVVDGQQVVVFDITSDPSQSSSIYVGGMRGDLVVAWAEPAAADDESLLSAPIYGLELCGVNLFANYSSYWITYPNLSGPCMSLPRDLHEMIKSWVVTACFPLKNGTPYDEICYVAANPAPKLSFRLSERGPRLSIDLEGVCFTRYVVWMEQVDPDIFPPFIALGTSVLSQFRYAVDYATRRVGFSPRYMNSGAVAAAMAADATASARARAEVAEQAFLSLSAKIEPQGCRAPRDCVGAQTFYAPSNSCEDPECSVYYFQRVDPVTRACRLTLTFEVVVAVFTILFAITEMAIYEFYRKLIARVVWSFPNLSLPSLGRRRAP